jgi:hypothetical protein
MAGHAPNPGVRVTLEDMARSWNRLAVEAEVMQREKRNGGLMLVKGSDPSVIRGGP